jgi:DNA invertase Pin-like site-specific DNA recombinase/transposase
VPQTLISSIDVVARSGHGVDLLRAVDYLRVSTEEQAKGYGISYTGKRTKNHITKKGWEYVRTYADEGYSGSLDHNERPDLKNLMRDAQQIPRPFDVVVVPEERAIGRRDRAFWPWVWKLEDLGIFVAIVRGDYDNTTEAGRSRMRKEADRAEDERVTIRDRTQGGRQEKAELGGHDGGVAPYGYRIENQGKRGESRLVLDTGEGDEGYPTLRRAYTLIVEEGKSPAEAEDVFNAESVPGPTKDYWPRGSLRRILTGRAIQESKRVFRDPKGAKTKVGPDGNPIYGDTVVIDLDPVFTPDEIKLLNLALARTSRGPRTSDTVIHPLSKHVYGTCGNYFTGVSWDGETTQKDRVYRCTGRLAEKKGTDKECRTCAQIDAEALENRVWNETCKLLEDPERLQSMAEDWVEMVKSNGVDYAARITELGEQIEEKEFAIDATTTATATRAKRRGLDRQATQEAIKRATRELEEELAGLEDLQREAISWQAEMEKTVDTARDLQKLASIARTHLHTMDVRQKEDIVDLLNLKVTILGPVPRRKTRKDDLISNWFRDRERVVPTITDEVWAVAERIIHKPRGRRASNPRALLDAVFTKARTGCAWADLAYGNVASVFKRWYSNGTWEELMEALADFPGTPVADSVILPPLRIEGRVDPRLLLSEDYPTDQDDPFKASDYKISPFELESALLEHEAVAEAAVVPAPDELRLAVPKAYVVLAAGWEPGPDTAKVLFEHSREVLAPYKRIRRLEFGDLPKTVSGKIRRIELREATAAGSDAEYSEEDFR